MVSDLIKDLTGEIERLPSYQIAGRVSGVLGQLIECSGLQGVLGIGGRCAIPSRLGHEIMCEVVGFRDENAMVMPFDSIDGTALGSEVWVRNAEPMVYPHTSWLGRVINALGEPIDGKGPLPMGPGGQMIRGRPPQAHQRRRVGPKIDLGVRALNTFITCCQGQRMGIFAASGVGKSILLSMMARFTSADVSVIGLIGERGREVQEFLQDDLGEAGLKRSVVVVSTSDESALMRRQAAFMTMACAEYFRDQGRQVLCLIDSITRFAMALREIGLAAGEPPASKGYTPSVFAELPRLLERAGPGTDEAAITGLFTVLVEGDDHDEPVSDAVRGILDGQIVMERAIAERGRYPAISILRSISRTLPNCNSDEENALVTKARASMAIYNDMEEMIRLGAYRRGSDAEVDEAMRLHPAFDAFLRQDIHERSELSQGYAQLAAILSAPAT